MRNDGPVGEMLYPPHTNFFRPVFCILGLPFDAVTLHESVAQVASAARDKQRCFFSTPNLNFLMGSQSDAAFRNSVIRSDLSVADGMPLIWVAKLLGLPLRERVAGSSMFAQLTQLASPPTVYFFGGPDGVAQQAAEKMNAATGGSRCVGHASPGFRPVAEISSAETIGRINAAAPDLLVVALGAKKGQAWIEHNLAQLQVPAVSHLGAVVNFVAGTVARAPDRMGRLGMEWLWRIREEPALWRRYFFDGMAFLSLLFKRVLPGMLHRLFVRPSRKQVEAARVVVTGDEHTCHLALSGAWTQANSLALREAFASVARRDQHVFVDFGNVTYIDSACIGVLMLLYGHQSKAGRSYQVSNIPPSIRATFNRQCAGFLIEPS